VGLLTTEKLWFKRVKWALWATLAAMVLAILYSIVTGKAVNYRPPLAGQQRGPRITPRF
jgi:hypothetical protein